MGSSLSSGFIGLTLEWLPSYDGLGPTDYMTHSGAQILSLGALEAAPRLIGMVLSTPDASGRIVETEAYTEDDPASHSYRGQRTSNAAMFLGAGHIYVYRSYGVHWCLNLVTGEAGVGEAVLIRALEPLTGIEAMSRRRKGANVKRLCAGPGNVALALGLDGSHSGSRLGEHLALSGETTQQEVCVGQRVGISAAVDWPRRFALSGSRHVSRSIRAVATLTSVELSPK